MYSNCLEIQYGNTGGCPLSHDISDVENEAQLAYIWANKNVMSFCLLALYRIFRETNNTFNVT